ncbi:TetR/AcrR family transcriptional regulator [Goodfellowiella coeruleoviolacea]|uniref:Transcriptional regulator, TetR family n=1 Tax=Goodfellowiella coeruleoviolacea TaxID=334858 RepID=A0AAE3GKD9_9PSEU|nr:TetR/AcrR family transcriptional regulator [Goodfellowiella coeruleoviolacea]MCP2169877.1 transcriptional regulator, TetR family [Goodfellowiella coeruleoviolacea]
MTAQTSRRDRLRRATLAEIREAARRLLTTQGSAAVTINAVAREVGISGPALYHYFASHEELVAAVTADFFQELTTAMRTARDAHAPDSPAARLLATCRAMRNWAVTHRAEFGWIFASPVPGPPPADQRSDSPRSLAGRDFELVFLDQVEALWATNPFPVPEPEDLAASVRAQLTPYAAELGRELPIAALHVALSCWIRLYGLLCMEVLNQLSFAYSDLEPLFEECLRDICHTLALDYQPPN